MRRIVFVLGCLTWVGHGRRAHETSRRNRAAHLVRHKKVVEGKEIETFDALSPVARLLLAFERPAAAWQVPAHGHALGMHHSGVKSVRSHPALVMRQTESRSAFPQSVVHRFQRFLMSFLVAGACMFGGIGDVPPALANPLTPEQEFVAEAWRTTDAFFVDRTFQGQDWFKVREKMVKKSYQDREAAYAEVRKMLESLDDKYTKFFDPKEYENFFSMIQGQVAGFGIKFKTLEKRADGIAPVAIREIIKDTPAERAGLKAGFVLLEIDGESLLGLNEGEVARKCLGDEGTSSQLVYSLPGEEGTKKVVITRAKIDFKPVESSMQTVGGKKVGYIKLFVFGVQSLDLVKSALESLKGASAYVLDLRQNQGGYFQGGIECARLFLKNDQTITTEVNAAGKERPYTTFADGPYSDVKLYVLVDDNTASASEVFSAALQDNGRATIIGPREQTFGKAIVQVLQPLSDNSALSITRAKYLTPQRTDINKRGVVVDAIRDETACPRGAAAVTTNCIPNL